MKRSIDSLFGSGGAGLALGLGLPSLLTAWSGDGGARARTLGLVAAVLLGIGITQLVVRLLRPGQRVTRLALLAAGVGLPVGAYLGAREWPAIGTGDVAGLTAGLFGGAIAAAPLWLGLGVVTARVRPSRQSLIGALVGAAVASLIELPVTVLPLVSAGLIFIGIILARHLEPRLDRRGRGSLVRAAAAVALALVAGWIATVAPALLAPRGLTASAPDPFVTTALCTLGLTCSVHARPGWFAAAAAGLVAAALLLPTVIPDSCGLAGAANPSRDGRATVSWTADGAVVELIDPLDRPRLYVNGQEQRTPIQAARDRLARSAGACPDADGEERAAAESVISGNAQQAIARARLALQICPGSPYAGALLGELLLARGVTRLRTGRVDGAERDLAEAIGLLSRPADLARAHLARGMVLLDLRRADEARESLLRATKIAPEHPAAAVATRRLDG